MQHLRFAIVAVLLVTLCLSIGLHQVFAQTATGSILGTVKDQTGALVPGVTVAIKSETTASTRSVTTTESGV
jgi:zinc transporter ZupT